MKLTRISELRRRELRQAAYEVLQTEGMAGATIEKVALKAGASKGIVLHYFETKQQLFEHAMRHSNALLRDGVIGRMRLARSPDERLWAIIAGNFSTAFFTPGICHAWLVLCAEVPREPQLARIQRIVHARMRSNLMSALAGLVPADQREADRTWNHLPYRWPVAEAGLASGRGERAGSPRANGRLSGASHSANRMARSSAPVGCRPGLSRRAVMGMVTVGTLFGR